MMCACKADATVVFNMRFLHFHFLSNSSQEQSLKKSPAYSFESRKFENFYFDTKLSSTRLRVLISKKIVFYFEFNFKNGNFENVLRNYNHEIGQSGELKFVQKGDYRTIITKLDKVGN